MPTVNDLRSKRFLGQEDVEPPMLVTIASYKKEDVSMENEPADLKYTLHFKENVKPFVCNWTNGRLIEAIVGSDDLDHWIGQQIVLYNDKNVSYAGKITGGIRVRASRAGQHNPDYRGNDQPAPKPSPAMAETDDGIPF